MTKLLATALAPGDRVKFKSSCSFHTGRVLATPHAEAGYLAVPIWDETTDRTSTLRLRPSEKLVRA